jgi:hypothetical protein
MGAVREVDAHRPNGAVVAAEAAKRINTIRTPVSVIIRVANISDTITVGVGLVWIRRGGTIVCGIGNAIGISICWNAIS